MFFTIVDYIALLSLGYVALLAGCVLLAVWQEKDKYIKTKE